ncbi:helix-turn-helix transcriptional regulator [Tenacibaculum singaporense]|uniref:Helix-turn-helix transcriptional regulator n=2 Tax=Tenacibaculum singaporense TaxID=2358479 RepID=A0A3Q8RLN2_9FLAO|nr:helix-turn-helix transcriptional regulator [Tenacibaculum singaporense]
MIFAYLKLITMIFASSKQRLKHYLDTKGISKAKFYRDTGIKRGFLDSDKLNSSISDTFLVTITDVYKDLNLSWLIAEAGKMEVNSTDAKWIEYGQFKLVPLISKRARAGFLSGWEDDEYIEELPKIPWEVDREYKGNYLTFEVVGDSMECDNPRESILEGDLLLGREVRNEYWTSKLHIHKWDFIIVHKTEGILVKRIIEHDVSSGKLILKSLNPYYEDQTVYMNDLTGIFNIVDIKRSRRR